MAQKNDPKQIQIIEDDYADLEQYWNGRNRTMLEHRSIINLAKSEKKEGEIKWMSNEPKVFYETSASLISSYPPRFRLPLSINYDLDEKNRMNKAERLIIGIFRALEERQHQNTWLREFAYTILSGWYAVFAVARKNGKSVDFIGDIWDPITVYPDWDSDGLAKCVRAFEMDRRTAKRLVSSWQSKGQAEGIELTPGDTTSRIQVRNWWLNDRGKIYNALLIDGKLAKPITLEKRLKRIPIFVGAIGVPEQTSPDWPVRYGENIIAANTDMYGYENQMVTLMATIMAETAFPNLISKTQTGTPVTKKGQKGYGEEIALRTGETLELLKHAATPAEVNVLINWASRQQQKGSIPNIVYGGLSVELSGFAISQLMAAIRYKIAPYLNVMQLVMGRVATEFLEQYRNGDGKRKFPKIKLATNNPAEIRKGLFFIEDFEPSDVPESSFVQVTIPITSAMDKTQQMLYARQAIQPPQLLSRETIWDDILDVQDAEQEYTRILQDQTLELPIVKQIGMIEHLRERVAAYENDNKFAEAAALRRYIMMTEMQLGMRKGIPTRPGEGVPPELSPPEMGATGYSPDYVRSAYGVTPPGLNRRPQTPEEREANRGRVGVLVSPTGEELL